MVPEDPVNLPAQLVLENLWDLAVREDRLLLKNRTSVNNVPFYSIDCFRKVSKEYFDFVMSEYPVVQILVLLAVLLIQYFLVVLAVQEVRLDPRNPVDHPFLEYFSLFCNLF